MASGPASFLKRVGAEVARQPHKLKVVGSNPAPASSFSVWRKLVPVLHQVIAAEKGQATSATSHITALLRILQKPSLFEGSVRDYTPKHEDGDSFPQERVPVQYSAEKIVDEAFASLRDFYDLVAHREYANLVAKADVIVDGVVIIRNVPAGYLLFLEKRVLDIHTFISAAPVLDTSVSGWSLDESSGLWNSGVARTLKTKKFEKALVLYDATDKHPAQTKTTTEDVVVGTWEARRQSGAIPNTKKEAMLSRINKLINAIRDARARANLTEAGDRPVIFDKISAYVLGS